MILFLDVISPLPEFYVIDDNKVIFAKKIISSELENLSDNIIQSYLEIDKELDLIQKLNKIALTIGPGSYTSLRVGAAFISGLRTKKQIPVCTISVGDIVNFKSQKNAACFITSAKNQRFLCYIKNNGNIEYSKIESRDFEMPININIIYYNFQKYIPNNIHFKQFKFSFVDELIRYNRVLKFLNKSIIKPIYISNNKILN